MSPMSDPIPAAISSPVSSVLKPTAAMRETFSRVTGANVNKTIVAQRVELQAIVLYAGDLVSGITFVNGTTAALAGGAHQLFGLYDAQATPNLLGGSNDDGAAAWAQSTAKMLSLTTAYRVTASGLYYLACLVDATTMPTLVGTPQSVGVSALPPALTGNSTTGVTALPAVAAAINSSITNIYGYVS